MRRLYGSFRFRLVLAATFWICGGVCASWFALSAIMRRHVAEEFQEELYHHGAELAALVTIGEDGRLALRQQLSDRRFFELGSGQYWQVIRTDGEWLSSPSLGTGRLPLGMPAHASEPASIRTLPGPSGPLRLLEQDVQVGGRDEWARLGLAVDVRLVETLLRRFDRTLALAVGVIAAGLVAAVFAQVTFGLWPLARVRDGLAAIRRGQSDRLPADLPHEVAPLAASLNAMIQANDDVVKRARTQAGNLAHALKTPLAILVHEGNRLDAEGQDGSVILRETERMRRQIDYQLAHARAAASRGRPNAAASVARSVDGIVSAMARLHRDRGIRFEITGIDEGVAAACEAEDLDELLGNLVENATKWARSVVSVGVECDRRTVRISIEDDGPGMPVAARESVFRIGERLDEQVPGHGLGLAIVREIAGLYDGCVTIEHAPGGGTIVRLELPRAGSFAE